MLGDYLLLYTVLSYGLSLIAFVTGFLHWFSEFLDVDQTPSPNRVPYPELNVVFAPIVFTATVATSGLLLVVTLLALLRKATRK